MPEAILRQLFGPRVPFGGSIAGLALLFIPLAADPGPARADDDGLRDALGGRPHFTAVLSNADTVPLVPDRGFSGRAAARLVLDDDELKLAYSIETDMDLNAGFPVTGASDEDDVTKIHLHSAPPGIAGPHVLNVYKLPAQDDGDLAVRPLQGRVDGLWDDGDLSDGLPPGPASAPLSDFLDELCDGNIYVNVHGTGDQGPGALRGNLEPTRRGERVCRALAGPHDDDDDDGDDDD